MRLPERSPTYLQVLPLALVLLGFVGVPLVVVVQRDGSSLRWRLGPGEGRYR